MKNMDTKTTQRIMSVDPEKATGEAKELLDVVKAKFGAVPNSLKVMANSPAVLKALLSFDGAIEGGMLPFETRNQIAIMVSEIHKCPYCLSVFTYIGKNGGVDDHSLQSCRMAGSTDPKIDAALKFAKAIVKSRGDIKSEDFDKVKSAGYSDGEIEEIVANVGLYTFSNYFTLVTKTEVDFPLVSPNKEQII